MDNSEEILDSLFLNRGSGKEDFDHKVEIALVVIGGDRRVRSRYLFSVDFCGDGDVLTHRQTEVVVRSGKFKSVSVCMVNHHQPLKWGRKEVTLLCSEIQLSSLLVQILEGRLA